MKMKDLYPTNQDPKITANNATTINISFIRLKRPFRLKTIGLIWLPSIFTGDGTNQAVYHPHFHKLDGTNS